MKKDQKENNPNNALPARKAEIALQPIVDEMRQSYLDYAMSVIVARALPDVRDGLKPVHRRILYAMWTLGLKHTGSYRKSATVVGEVLGKYHPHGDAAVYDTLVRMAQDFSLRYTLVNGQGNFGSMDGDAAAAMRYCVTDDTLIVTEHGLKRIGTLSKSEDVNIKVLSRGRKVHAAVKWFDSGIHPTLKITTHKGYSLEGSYNHPILIWKKDESGSPKFEWKTLEKVQVGDVAVLDRSSCLWPKKNVELVSFFPKPKNNRVQVKKLPAHLNEDLAFILGSLVSEGCIQEHKIEFCNSDFQWVEEFQNRWREIFPDCRLHVFKKEPTSYGKKKYWRVEIHSRYVIEFLKNIGLTPVLSAQKFVPEIILSSPKKVVRMFLRSYFEGDGSISSSKKFIELSACSTSKRLLEEIQILLLRFEIDSFQRFDNYRHIHKLYIRSYRNYERFYRTIGFLYKKQDKLKNVLSQFHVQSSKTDFIPYLSTYVRGLVKHSYDEGIVKHNFDRYDRLEHAHDHIQTAVLEKTNINLSKTFELLLQNRYLFEPIIDIQSTGFKRVYSLKVQSECHSFVGNGFINHNTEAKLASIAEELLHDIDKQTVPFVPNYDGSQTEPTVFPAKLPNLLLNGAVGIAVGMATSIPPHNLTELCDGITHLIDHPDTQVEGLMQFVKGPDFPTGATIFDSKEIIKAYSTGKGAIVMRANAEIIEEKGERFKIIVTEIPYQVNKASILEKIAEHVREKKLEGIKDLRDESSEREGVRIVIELKKDSYPKKVLNQLYQLTQLQETFHVNMLALVDGIQPRVLTLKMVLEEYIKHRENVIRKRTEYDLEKAKDRAHILEGLKLALAHINQIIETIKKSQDKEEAKVNLIKKFKLSERQTLAILEMRLHQLANLERIKIEQELKEKLALIKDLEEILGSQKKIRVIVKTELAELKQKFGDERKTKIVAHGVKDFTQEDLIPDEEIIVVITRDGYIKSLPPDTFRTQVRGGKGVIGLTTKEEDAVEHFFATTTHSNILFFTTRGRVYQLSGYEIPKGSRTARGQAIVNFLQLAPNEKISSALPLSELSDFKYLVMVTRLGNIKKVDISDLESVRKSGLIAIKLKPNDHLEWVKPSGGGDDIMLITSLGQAIRFKEKQIRSMGRGAAGVRGIRLKKDDRVVGMDVVDQALAGLGQLLVVMSKGYGKRTSLKQYKTQSRGGMGIKTAKVTSKTGNIISAMVVNSKVLEEDLIIISDKGQVIRLPINTISVVGRATQGVRLMKFKEGGDEVASTTFV